MRIFEIIFIDGEKVKECGGYRDAFIFDALVEYFV
jgi:hypothetical protein